jgi:hypothetical protein
MVIEWKHVCYVTLSPPRSRIVFPDFTCVAFGASTTIFVFFSGSRVLFHPLFPSFFSEKILQISGIITPWQTFTLISFPDNKESILQSPKGTGKERGKQGSATIGTDFTHRLERHDLSDDALASL